MNKSHNELNSILYWISGILLILLPLLVCVGFSLIGYSCQATIRSFVRDGSIIMYLLLWVVGISAILSVFYENLAKKNIFSGMIAVTLICSILFIIRGYYSSGLTFFDLFGSYSFYGFFGSLILHITFLIGFIVSILLLLVRNRL